MELLELRQWFERSDLVMTEVFSIEIPYLENTGQITGTFMTRTNVYECVFGHLITVMLENKKVIFESDSSEESFRKMLIAILRNELIRNPYGHKSDPEPQPTLMFMPPSRMTEISHDEIKHSDVH